MPSHGLFQLFVVRSNQNQCLSLARHEKMLESYVWRVSDLMTRVHGHPWVQLDNASLEGKIQMEAIHWVDYQRVKRNSESALFLVLVHRIFRRSTTQILKKGKCDAILFFLFCAFMMNESFACGRNRV